MKGEYKKALIYCRVSSEKQVREGNGLDSQEHRCREYAKSLDLKWKMYSKIREFPEGYLIVRR